MSWFVPFQMHHKLYAHAPIHSFHSYMHFVSSYPYTTCSKYNLCTFTVRRIFLNNLQHLFSCYRQYQMVVCTHGSSIPFDSNALTLFHFPHSPKNPLKFQLPDLPGYLPSVTVLLRISFVMVNGKSFYAVLSKPQDDRQLTYPNSSLPFPLYASGSHHRDSISSRGSSPLGYQ